MQKLILASHNQGKIDELQQLLAALPVQIVGAKALGLADPIEDGATYAENAAIKARAACLATGLPALADDSGLSVAALDGAPGVQSARWAENEQGARNFPAAMQKLWGLVADKDKAAAFYCTLAYITPEMAATNSQPKFFTGHVDGKITWPMRGSHGFGYDPVFQPDEGDGRCFAEMTSAEKKQLSHRGRAFDAFLSFAQTEFTL